MIDKLLLEKIPLAGIARVVVVSERWLQRYVNKKYASQARGVTVSEKKTLALTVECDELWSFVNDKGNKQWVWLAIDCDSAEIVCVHVGDRSADSARALGILFQNLSSKCHLL